MSNFKCDCHGRSFKNRYSVATHKKWVSGVLNSSQHEKSLNGMWKANASLHKTSVHEWVNDNIGIKKICVKCGSNKNIDLANKTGLYERDFSNWEYLCRRCHMKSDNRMNNLKQFKGAIII